MSFDLLVAFVTFAFVMSATPGPNVMLVLASVINHGLRPTIPHMAGVTIGFSMMLIAVGLGLGQLFIAYPPLHAALQIASIAYLLWLAWRLAAASSAPEIRKAPPMTFLQAAAFQWVNPKAWSISLAVVAAYTVPTRFYESLLTASAVFLVITLCGLAIWAGFGLALRKLLEDPRRLRVFNLTMAVLLVASLWPMVSTLVRH